MKAHSRISRTVLLPLLFCCLIFSLRGLLAAQSQSATGVIKPTSRLTVEIRGLRNATGQILVKLSRDGNAVEARAVPIEAKSRTAQIVFDNLPRAEYAVSFIHDENMNGKLDYNFFGMPAEGYGFSNNPPKGFGPPKYELTIFPLKEPERHIDIKVIYW